MKLDKTGFSASLENTFSNPPMANTIEEEKNSDIVCMHAFIDKPISLFACYIPGLFGETKEILVNEYEKNNVGPILSISYYYT